MKKLTVFYRWGLIVVMAITGSVVFHQCSQEDDMHIPVKKEAIHSKADYEMFFRAAVSSHMGKKGKFEDHFIGLNGFPVWEELKWYETENNQIMTVPLVTGESAKMVLVGMVKEDGIMPFVVEVEGVLTKAGESRGKIYALDHTLLYDPAHGGVVTRAMDNNIENTVKSVFENNTNASDIFKAANNNAEYDPAANFGTLKICTNMDASSGSDLYSGHSWIELNYDMNVANNTYSRTTFSLYSEFFTDKPTEYVVDEDLNKAIESEMSMPVTYGQLQQILDYNKNKDNVDWSINNNCTDYSIAVWNLVSDDKIPVEDFGDLVRPKELTDYIKNKR